MRLCAFTCHLCSLCCTNTLCVLSPRRRRRLQGVRSLFEANICTISLFLSIEEHRARLHEQRLHLIATRSLADAARPLLSPHLFPFLTLARSLQFAPRLRFAAGAAINSARGKFNRCLCAFACACLFRNIGLQISRLQSDTSAPSSSGFSCLATNKSLIRFCPGRAPASGPADIRQSANTLLLPNQCCGRACPACQMTMISN